MTDVVRTIITIIAHTPVWVWALYSLLMYLGLQRARDSTVHVARLLILPIAVMLMTVMSFFSTGSSGLLGLLSGLMLGGIAGWQLGRKDATRRHGGGRLWLRGEWLSFSQIVLVLAFRYATNVVAAMNPELNANPVWHTATLFTSAVLSALLLGRTAAKLRVYFIVGAADWK